MKLFLLVGSILLLASPAAAKLPRDDAPNLAYAGSRSVLCPPRFSSSDTTMRQLLSPRDLALEDLDGDDDLDLITVIGAGELDVSVLLGDGQGGFGPDQRYPIGQFSTDLAVGDVDADGFKDVVVIMVEVGHIGVFWGLPGGAFSTLMPIRTSGGPNYVTVADLDGDGYRDIAATADTDAAVTVLWGDSTRTFDDRRRYALPVVPRFTAAGDVDGDGRMDLLATSCTNGSAYTLLGVGTRFFAPAIEATSSSLRLCSITVGDLNGDAYADVVVTASAQDSVLAGIGRADGRFEALPFSAQGVSPIRAALADLNGDGISDVIISNIGYDAGYHATVMLGVGNGTFIDLLPLPAVGCIGGAAAGDLNGDGGVDIAVLTSCSSMLHVYYNRQTVELGTLELMPASIKSRAPSIDLVARVSLTPPMVSGWSPSDLRLIWHGSEILGPATTVAADVPAGAISISFAAGILAMLPVGEQRLAVEGCDSLGRAFRGESVLRVLPNRKQNIWQASPPGMVPVSVQLSSQLRSSVIVDVFDSRGRLIRSQQTTVPPSGVISWDTRNSERSPLPSGIYILRLRGTKESCKVIVLR